MDDTVDSSPAISQSGDIVFESDNSRKEIKKSSRSRVPKYR